VAETKKLVTSLQDWKPTDFQKVMKVSENISHLNHERYQLWDQQASHPALAYFKGDVYRGLATEDFNDTDWQYAQETVNILSGLYGVLRANDSIKNHRLEMGTKWAPTDKNLYEFWDTKVTKTLNQSESEIIINLASQEYFKVIKKDLLTVPVINPIFKENKNGVYKIVAIHAKRARGLMTRYAVKNKITNPQDLKKFDLEDYKFDPSLSNETDWVFVR